MFFINSQFVVHDTARILNTKHNILYAVKDIWGGFPSKLVGF